MEESLERCGRVRALCEELASVGSDDPSSEENERCADEKNSPFSPVPLKLLVRIISYLPIEDEPFYCCCCRRWRLAACSPVLWRERCERAADLAMASMTQRRSEWASQRSDRKKLQSGLEAAGRALAASPSKAYIELRDALASAARGSMPPPSPEVAVVLDSACLALGRPFGTSKKWRLSLEGPLLRMPVALRKLDVAKLFVENPAALGALCRIVERDDFPSPSAAGRKYLLVGRLATWCVAAASLGENLAAARRRDDLDDTALVAARAEKATQTWIALRKERQKQQPTAAALSPAISSRRTPGARRKKKASQSAPPASPSLYDIFVDAKRSGPAQTDVERCANLLRKFYQKHNPSLVPKADAIAREWQGSETTLFALLRYKYSNSPPPIPPVIPTSPAPSKTTPTTSSTGGNSAGGRPHVSRSRPRRSSLPPPQQQKSAAVPPPEAALLDEIAQLKSTVDKAQSEAERAKSRAKAATAEARRARELLSSDREQVSELKRTAQALRIEKDQTDLQLRRLREHATEKKRELTPISEFACDQETALDAVMSAVIDVLLTESAIEIDFELEFGVGEDDVVVDQRLSREAIVANTQKDRRRSRSTSPARVMPLLPINHLDDVPRPPLRLLPVDEAPTA